MIRSRVNADIFEFEGAFGDDVITDFNVASALERIDLRGVNEIINFDDLITNHLSENADGDAVITVVGNTITLQGVSTSVLQDADFIF